MRVLSVECRNHVIASKQPSMKSGFNPLAGRRWKRWVMVLADMLMLPLALWSAFALRHTDWWPVRGLEGAAWLFLALPIVGVLVFARLGLYRAVVRFMGPQAVMAVIKGVLLLALMLWLSAYWFQIPHFPRSVPAIFMLVALAYVGGSRFLVRAIYHLITHERAAREPVIIYGAGGAGVQLAAALAVGREYRLVAFIDEAPALWGTLIRDARVHGPEELETLIGQFGVRRILLAIPSATRGERKRILESLAAYPVRVQTVPAIGDIVAGTAAVDQLQEIDIADLLGRDPVPPRPELLAASITGKVVMVTGAGGSIGSELCRQVLRHSPRALVLYEMSEYALYAIENELRTALTHSGGAIALYPVLGSVGNLQRVHNTLNRFGVQTLYHAAAYKHVPIVEHNILEGIANNVFGTQTVANAAAACGVERFILISTDKAVRPTNVMGASKRVAEMILQDLARQDGVTVFSMVRFGNVLGSSGSVVPRFQSQIASGGPITVTHPDITRYFMTIPEAAELVIQAGAMAHGGEVFVLDMGEPVRILDLAKRMIHLAGLELRDTEHPEGNIEIVFTGLRPGEKLYEELLIGDNVVGTTHPKIMRAMEDCVPTEVLQEALPILQRYMDSCRPGAARSLLERMVQGYRVQGQVVDWLAEKGLRRASETSAC